MTLRSQLLVAAALVAGVVGLQSNTASAMPGIHIDSAVSTSADGAHVDNVRWCNWHGCYRTYGYGYGYRPYAYGYRPYAYYRPYGYRYVVPGVRLGFY